MGIEHLGSALLKTALLPFAIAADSLTMGGLLTDEDEPYSFQTFESIGEDIEDMFDDF